MADLLVTATLRNNSGIERDNLVNSFAVQGGGANGMANLGEVTTAFAGFYQTIAPYLSTAISRAAAANILDVYNIAGALDGSPHGSPVFSDTMTLPAAQVGYPNLPSEVAVACTWKAFLRDVQPVERADGADAGIFVDRPMQRYTGRVFLGPLTTYAIEQVASQEPRVLPAFITAIQDAADQLQTDLLARANGPWQLSVWSRSDATLRGVEYARVDNAFDTQRRRGTAPSTSTQRLLGP